jgi:hypothetical protein
MKNSDSINSLTELNEMKNSTSTDCLVNLDKNEGENSCLICIDDETTNKLINSNNFFRCDCKFLIHETCFKGLIKHKPDFKCPLCSKHTLIITNTIFEDEREKMLNNGNKTLLFCLILVIIVGIINLIAFFV